MITGNEAWFHHFDPQSKIDVTEWRLSTSPRKKKFNVTPSAGKVMVIIFRDTTVVILVDIMPRDEIINSDLDI